MILSYDHNIHRTLIICVCIYIYIYIYIYIIALGRVSLMFRLGHMRHVINWRHRACMCVCAFVWSRDLRCLLLIVMAVYDDECHSFIPTFSRSRPLIPRSYVLGPYPSSRTDWLTSMIPCYTVRISASDVHRPECRCPTSRSPNCRHKALLYFASQSFPPRTSSLSSISFSGGNLTNSSLNYPPPQLRHSSHTIYSDDVHGTGRPTLAYASLHSFPSAHDVYLSAIASPVRLYKISSFLYPSHVDPNLLWAAVVERPACSDVYAGLPHQSPCCCVMASFGIDGLSIREIVRRM